MTAANRLLTRAAQKRGVPRDRKEAVADAKLGRVNIKMNADRKMVGFIGVHRVHLWLNRFLPGWARAPLAYVRGPETQCADTVADAKLAQLNVRSSGTPVASRQNIIGHR